MCEGAGFSATISGMSELQGSSILIVGASGGLGRVIAAELASKGALLTLAGRSKEWLEAIGVPGVHAVGDVTQPGVPESYVDTAVAAHQRLDGVVYAAGAVAFGSVSELSDEIADSLWKVNTRGWMGVVRASMPALTQSAQEGRSPWIITLSGVVSEAPTAGIAAYSAVKAALHAYGVAAGRELRRSGIRLMDARPGHTETELSQHPLAGQAPTFPAGLAPTAVAKRIVEAIEADEKDLPSTAFHGLS
jgi:cyclic-di-GMP-binding biofilm dispersal mediator protein